MLWSDLERLGRLFDPWSEFERLNRSLWNWRPYTDVEFPAVNMWVSEDEAVVTTEIPGISAETIDISLAGNSLTLRGSRKPEELKEGETYHRKERWEGQFSKVIELPFNVEGDKIDARVINGVLYIKLPRAEAEKPRKIAVKST